MLSDRIVYGLVAMGTLTLWSLWGQEWWENLLIARGGTLGMGEMFLGYSLPVFFSMFVAFILIKKLRSSE